MTRPWTTIPIHDDGEPLIPLPPELLRLEPHPYQALGAPYGETGSPFQLRSGVVARLLEAQRNLRCHHPSWRLAIFDAWRPVGVQAYMVRHAIRSTCLERGLDPDRTGPGHDAVIAEVGRFWAPPSTDPAAPPPHSTGAAVDLTLADSDRAALEMGGAIDAIAPESEPDHYAGSAAPGALGAGQPEGASHWHRRRLLLRQVMEDAGFAQHPNEWWHFSHGDQLWAWRRRQPRALYGGWVPAGD